MSERETALPDSCWVTVSHQQFQVAMKPKTISQNDMTAQKGVNLIERVVLEMGSRWNPTIGAEAGIDGYIELRDPNTGAMTGGIIRVQSKAGDSYFRSEDTDKFEFLCDKRDLDYWLAGNAPVILVVSRPEVQEAYWVSIKDYFADPVKRQSKKIVFDKHKTRFSADNFSLLLGVAQPYGTGLYLTPRPVQEVIFTNLLSVQYFGEHLYVGQTRFRKAKEVTECLREYVETPSRDYVLWEGKIISFNNLRDYPWDKVCDAVESFSTAEWAYSLDEHRLRIFVWLLNECLKEKEHHDLKYDKDSDYFYFKAEKGMQNRRIKYRGLQQSSSITVFQAVYQKKNPGQRLCYRHLAFFAKFRQLGEAWYLQILPTYRFTSNGWDLFRLNEDYLTGKKRLDRNSTVLSHVRLIAEFIGRSKEDIFRKDYEHLRFGELKSIDIEGGLIDDEWLQKEPQDVATTDDNLLFGDL